MKILYIWLDIYDGISDLSKHHHNLQSLSDSAERGCLLCTSIWQQCASFLPVDTHAHNSPLSTGEFGGQITLGLSDWSPERDGMPHLNTVQQLARGAVYTLATVDVFVESARVSTGFETMLARAVQIQFSR